MSDTITYAGPYPIPATTIDAWTGAGATDLEASVTVDLHDLVEAGGIDGANDAMDELLGVVLGDLQIEVDHTATGGLTGSPYGLVLRVSGTLPDER